MIIVIGRDLDIEGRKFAKMTETLGSRLNAALMSMVGFTSPEKSTFRLHLTVERIATLPREQEVQHFSHS